MKIRNPFSFNKSGWKDDVTKKEKFWWVVLLSVIYSAFISSIVYEISTDFIRFLKSML